MKFCRIILGIALILGTFLLKSTVLGQTPKTAKTVGEGPPEIKVYTVSPPLAGGGGFGKKKNETLLLSVNTDANRTIIAGTDIEGLKLYCEAEYPIHWTYEGTADFNFLSTSSGSYSRSIDGVENNEFYETVFLDPLSEAYSAKYVCYGRDKHQHRSSVYIFVPGKNLFVSLRGRNVYFTTSGDKINIPCAVSHPKVEVTLSKLNERSNELRRVIGAEFDPMSGFTLDTSKVSNPVGKYVCTAKKGRRVKVVQHSVLRDELPEGQRCTQGCPENSHCVLGRRGYESSYCKCDSSYTSLDFDSRYLICVRKCQDNLDCPENMSCQLRDPESDQYFWSSVANDREKKEFTKVCKNPCIYSHQRNNPPQQCSPHTVSLCKVENQVAKC